MGKKFNRLERKIEREYENKGNEGLKIRNHELFEENKILVKAIDIVTAKLETVGIKLDTGVNHLSG